MVAISIIVINTYSPKNINLLEYDLCHPTRCYRCNKGITYIASFPNMEIMMSTYLDLSYTMQSIYQIDYNKPALSILLNF